MILDIGETFCNFLNNFRGKKIAKLLVIFLVYKALQKYLQKNIDTYFRPVILTNAN